MVVLRRQDGFTLIEIMVVVGIIALLTALVAPTLMSRFAVAKEQTARAQVSTLAQSVRTFQLDTGRLPSAAEGLRVLIPPPPTSVRHYNADGYLDDVALPLDPWDNEYDYRVEGTRFTIVSYGADGVPSEDDITNRTSRR